jgi:hypothetical protein
MLIIALSPFQLPTDDAGGANLRGFLQKTIHHPEKSVQFASSVANFE